MGKLMKRCTKNVACSIADHEIQSSGDEFKDDHDLFRAIQVRLVL